MKTKLIFKIIIILVCVYNGQKLACQTNISGGIFTNTTWTLGSSPYVVTGNVVVFPGCILTIEPGVTVKFSPNTRLEIRQSKLIAQGTVGNSIYFTSSDGNPGPGSWDRIYLNSSSAIKLKYCDFKYAGYAFYGHADSIFVKNTRFLNNTNGMEVHAFFMSLDSSYFKNNTVGIRWTGGGSTHDFRNSIFVKNGSGFVTPDAANIINCTIDSNTVVGVERASGKGDTVRNNIFRENAIGLVSTGSGGGGLTYIHHNIISNNTIGVRYFQGSAQDSVYCNSICFNTQYNLKFDMASNKDFSNNYWGTINYAVIDSLIYDAYDDIGCGLATFAPINYGSCDFTTVISENKNAECNIFPNPASKEFNIILVESGEEMNLQVLDVNGRLLLERQFETSTQVDVADLPKGVYVVRVRGKDVNLSKRVVLVN